LIRSKGEKRYKPVVRILIEAATTGEDDECNFSITKNR